MNYQCFRVSAEDRKRAKLLVKEIIEKIKIKRGRDLAKRLGLKKEKKKG